MRRTWLTWLLALALILSGTALAEGETGATLDDDMSGFQLILPDDPAPTPEPAPQDLSHLMLGQTYNLPGVAKVKPMSFGYVDSLAQYAEGADLSLKRWISFGYNRGDVRLGRFTNYTRAQMHDSYVLLIGGEMGLDPKDWSDEGLAAHLEVYLNSGYDNSTTFIPECGWLESGLGSEFACIDFQVVNMGGKAIDLTKSADVTVRYDEARYKGFIYRVNEGIGEVYRYYHNQPGTHYPYAVIHPNDASPIATGQVGTYVVGALLPSIALEEKDTPISITLVLEGNEMTFHIR